MTCQSTHKPPAAFWRAAVMRLSSSALTVASQPGLEGSQRPCRTRLHRASGHAQRGCLSDADCGGSPNSCESVPRNCFLTGGGTFQPSGHNDGTDTLTAVGVADPPINDVSHPTLASVFCVWPPGSRPRRREACGSEVGR